MAFIKNESNVAPTMGAGALSTSYKMKMYRSVVFIETNNSKYGQGTGSIVDYFNCPQPMLLTCHHVIPSMEIAKQCTIYFDWENSAKRGIPVSGGKLFDFSQTFHTSPDQVEETLGLDFSLIPLKTSAIPNSKERVLLALDQNLAASYALKKNDGVYLVHYPLMDGEFVRRESPYLIQFLNGFLFGHLAETHGGSSGCPVLKEVDKQWVLVGLHRGTINKPTGKSVEINCATNIEAIHKFCTVRGYKPPAIDNEAIMQECTRAIDKQKMEGALQEGLGQESKEGARTPQSEAVLNTYVTKYKKYSKHLRLYVADKAGANWQSLAACLTIPKPIIAQKSAYGRSTDDALHDLLEYWAGENCKDSPPTWSNLLEAMTDAKMTKEAGELERFVLSF